ncbi:Gfo/Idh/MocA family oxidoreductase [Acidisoma cellulosilytica]|uniref:Gfo/Idh/MocA family oxidoreductase n=1 Tax=Acidisoma cellulosilyticum TaxID=2802395 RepID=A0A963Z251_9PROT|nr:Gfo/Idh/MocA family oxidoreductase [Acidisoma cellulosilyticum]MCB8881458.1 Gfo/Idh/MocA family oxidoreductase [Acidisoma cellulosilyticum]
MTKQLGIGIIGCGTISAAYLKAAGNFPVLALRGLADVNSAAAEARSAEFDVPAMTVEAMLADPSIDIVINLTIPLVHVDVGLRVLAAGKHVYSEKPLGVTTEEAKRLLDAAENAGRRLGCAPDTFLGGGQQTCRALLDEGAIGRPVGGTAFFLCPGHERWHPAPAFYYQSGGGPMLDMGPYYITSLVNLLGPVARVAGVTTMMRDSRVITSEPLAGQSIAVEVPTHVAGTLHFVSGAVISIAMSFDVPKHKHLPLELYGTEGSMIIPDPNHFGGEIELASTGGDWTAVETRHAYGDGNYRILGVADMAQAILEDRPHRASGAMAYHVLEVMEAFERSSASGQFVTIASTVERPAPMPTHGI